MSKNILYDQEEPNPINIRRSPTENFRHFILVFMVPRYRKNVVFSKSSHDSALSPSLDSTSASPPVGIACQSQMAASTSRDNFPMRQWHLVANCDFFSLWDIYRMYRRYLVFGNDYTCDYPMSKGECSMGFPMLTWMRQCTMVLNGETTVQWLELWPQNRGLSSSFLPRGGGLSQPD